MDFRFYKKSLKIPKRSSESVNRRRTHNTMVKKKKGKKDKDLQNNTQKTKNRATRTPLKAGGGAEMLLKGKQFLLNILV